MPTYPHLWGCTLVLTANTGYSTVACFVDGPHTQLTDNTSFGHGPKGGVCRQPRDRIRRWEAAGIVARGEPSKARCPWAQNSRRPWAQYWYMCFCTVQYPVLLPDDVIPVSYGRRTSNDLPLTVW